MWFSSYQNYELKIKLWGVGARERKKRTFFVTFIFPESKFFSICVLSQCIVYLINFQNAYTFTYQKKLLHTLFCLLLKSLKAFSVLLNIFQKVFVICIIFCYLKLFLYKEKVLFFLCNERIIKRKGRKTFQKFWVIC